MSYVNLVDNSHVQSVQMYGLKQFPLVKKGDHIGKLICDHIEESTIQLEQNDVIIIAQKIISIAEGAFLSLKEINPSKVAKSLSQATGRDPRLCQVIINESKKIIETKGKVIVTEHRLGFRCTSAGVDKSNVARNEDEVVSLLPLDPDNSAREIREYMLKRLGVKVAIIINDSFGEPSREGSRGVGIGIAGIEPVRKEKTTDLYGNPKQSFINRVDEIAGAASAIMGQTNGVPIVIGRGFQYTVDDHASIQDLLIKEDVDKARSWNHGLSFSGFTTRRLIIGGVTSSILLVAWMINSYIKQKK